MAQNGSLTVRVSTSRAQLPITGATVVVTTLSERGTPIVLSILETNESGLAGPIQLPAPTTPTEGTSPGGPTPYSTYSLLVEHPGFEIAVVDSFQIFPNVMSIQNISLIPLSGSLSPGGTSDRISAPPQTL